MEYVSISMDMNNDSQSYSQLNCGYIKKFKCLMMRMNKTSSTLLDFDHTFIIFTDLKSKS